MEEKSVSDPLSCLLIDMGNSRIKFAFAKGKEGMSKIYACDNTAALTEHIKFCEQVLLSSVGDVYGVAEVKVLCDKYAKNLNIIQTQAENFGIYCDEGTIPGLQSFKNKKSFFCKNQTHHTHHSL
jgi:pantothenate kinase type III